MDIKYPCTSVTASELATVNRTNCFDGIVGLTDFAIEVLTDPAIASGTGHSEVSVSAGECWIAGRYWKSEANAVIRVPFSAEKQIVKIKCDTTGDEPVEFSIYASADDPISAAGIYEIPIGAIQYGNILEQNIPLSNGGEFPGVKIYEGNLDGYIRARKVSDSVAEIYIELWNENPGADGSVLNIQIPAKYMPVLSSYNMVNRKTLGSSFVFVGETGHRTASGNVNDGLIPFYISSDGVLTAQRNPIGQMTFAARAIYSIGRE